MAGKNFHELTVAEIQADASGIIWDDLDKAYRTKSNRDKAAALVEINKKLLDALANDRAFIDAILKRRNALIFLAECLLAVPASDLPKKSLEGFKKLRGEILNVGGVETRPFNIILAATVAAEMVRNPNPTPDKDPKNSAAYKVVNTFLVEKILDKILWTVSFGYLRSKTATAARLDKTKKLFTTGTNGQDSTRKVTQKILDELGDKIYRLTKEDENLWWKSRRPNAVQKIQNKKAELEDLREQYSGYKFCAMSELQGGERALEGKFYIERTEAGLLQYCTSLSNGVHTISEAGVNQCNGIIQARKSELIEVMQSSEGDFLEAMKPYKDDIFKITSERNHTHLDQDKNKIGKSQDDARAVFSRWKKEQVGKVNNIIQAGPRHSSSFFGDTWTQNFVKRAEMVLEAKETLSPENAGGQSAPVLVDF